MYLVKFLEESCSIDSVRDDRRDSYKFVPWNLQVQNFKKIPEEYSWFRKNQLKSILRGVFVNFVSEFS